MSYLALCCMSAVFPCLSKFRLEINRIFFSFLSSEILGQLSSENRESKILTGFKIEPG